MLATGPSGIGGQAARSLLITCICLGIFTLPFGLLFISRAHARRLLLFLALSAILLGAAQLLYVTFSGNILRGRGAGPFTLAHSDSFAAFSRGPAARVMLGLPAAAGRALTSFRHQGGVRIQARRYGPMVPLRPVPAATCLTTERRQLSWLERMAFYYATAGASDARIVIVGMPLDRTSSFVPGARFGPDFVRVAADNIESFSPYQKRDLSGLPVHDAGNINFTFGTPTAPLELIAATTARNLARGAKQLAIGGEHTITPAIVSELAKTMPDLCVIQYDAHSDLRQEFLGERVCHATAMARVLDSIPRERLFQLGIRSFSSVGEMTARNVFPFDVLSPLSQVRAAIGKRPVYVTLDVDVLDPGAMPDVQTPEPGGCSYRDLAESLAALAGLQVVGCDLVEVCPRTMQPSAGSAAAAELARELCLLLA